jgi:hypothetical protein
MTIGELINKYKNQMRDDSYIEVLVEGDDVHVFCIVSKSNLYILQPFGNVEVIKYETFFDEELFSLGSGVSITITQEQANQIKQALEHEKIALIEV